MNTYNTLTDRHSYSSLQSYTPRIMEFHYLCRILPGAISHRSDIVTLWQNNLAGINLKLHKVLYNLPINYSSRGAYVAARRSCAVSRSFGLCMEAIPRGLHLKYISVQTCFDCCERAAAKSSAGVSLGLNMHLRLLSLHAFGGVYVCARPCCCLLAVEPGLDDLSPASC